MCIRDRQYPDRCAEVMKAVADKVKEMDVDVIVGPAMGGIVYADVYKRQIYAWSATSGSVMMVGWLEFSRTVSMPSAFRARQACVPE